MTVYYSYGYFAINENKKNITVYNNHIAIASSIDEAVFIRRIIYLWEKHKKNGQMFIVPKKFTLPVGMSLYTFRKIVKKWEKLGIIKTKSKGLPLKKWYKINEKRLAKYLSEVKEQGSTTYVNEIDKISYRNEEDKLSKSLRYYNKSNIREKNKNTISAKQVRSSLYTSDKPSFDKKQSLKLEELLREKRKFNSRTKPRSWSAQFLEFRRKNNISKKRFSEVMKFYCKHFGDKFVPKAYFANMFCDKFIQIEEARERLIKEIAEGKPRNIKRKKIRSVTIYGDEPQQIDGIDDF